MLLLLRSSASKFLNLPVCFGVLLLGVVASCVTDEGIASAVTPLFPWLLLFRRLFGSTQVILMGVLVWRRCCLAARVPCEPSLCLFLLFLFFFLSFFAFTHRLRFLSPKTQHIQVILDENSYSHKKFMQANTLPVEESVRPWTDSRFFHTLLTLFLTGLLYLLYVAQKLPDRADRQQYNQLKYDGNLSNAHIHTVYTQPYPLALGHLWDVRFLIRTHWSHVGDIGSKQESKSKCYRTVLTCLLLI